MKGSPLTSPITVKFIEMFSHIQQIVFIKGTGNKS